VPTLFRGTSEGYPGSPGNQRVGITPTTTNPAVATVFGTQSSQYGNGVVHVAVPGDVAAVDILPSGYSQSPTLGTVEAEIPVNMPPAQFANQASVTITAAQARSILSDMGINISGNITAQGSDLTNLLKGLPTLTSEQVQTFVQKAMQLSKGK